METSKASQFGGGAAKAGPDEAMMAAVLASALGGDLSALETVMSRSYGNTRSGEVGAPGGDATTVAVQIHVVEGR